MASVRQMMERLGVPVLGVYASIQVQLFGGLPFPLPFDPRSWPAWVIFLSLMFTFITCGERLFVRIWPTRAEETSR